MKLTYIRLREKKVGGGGGVVSGSPRSPVRPFENFGGYLGKSCKIYDQLNGPKTYCVVLTPISPQSP